VIAATARSEGRLVGGAALASVACWVGALGFANATGGAINQGAALGQPTVLNRARELTDFHRGRGDQTIAVGLRLAGLVLAAAVVIYLYRIVRARRPQLSRRSMLGTGLGGALLIAVSTVFGYFALAQVSDVFAAGALHTAAHARHLIDASGSLKLAAALDLSSRLVFAAWIAIVSLEMLRADLLDRFLAYWGFGACGALALLPIGDAMFIAWLGSIGVIALGYWPGGRPKAWSPAVSATP
jgi:hypothetical protein